MIPCTWCSDRERTVDKSPLSPWKKEIEARNDERVGMSVTGVSTEQVGDVVWCMRDRLMSCERVDTVACTRLVVHVKCVSNATREGRELHGHVVSGQARVSLACSGPSGTVTVLPLHWKRHSVAVV